MKQVRALVCPVEGQVYCKKLDDTLETWQGLVGGHIEAIRLPAFIEGARQATGYVNEEGKFTEDCKPNMRATDFMVPGVGLFASDYIAGTFVVVGFDASTGEHRDVPAGVVTRWNLIALEATGEKVVDHANA